VARPRRAMWLGPPGRQRGWHQARPEGPSGCPHLGGWGETPPPREAAGCRRPPGKPMAKQHQPAQRRSGGRTARTPPPRAHDLGRPTGAARDVGEPQESGQVGRQAGRTVERRLEGAGLEHQERRRRNGPSSSHSAKVEAAHPGDAAQGGPGWAARQGCQAPTWCRRYRLTPTHPMGSGQGIGPCRRYPVRRRQPSGQALGPRSGASTRATTGSGGGPRARHERRGAQR